MSTLFRLPALLLCTLLASCVSSGKSVDTDYYLLSSPQLPDQKLLRNDIKMIALGPITFADYLKRPSIIERSSEVKAEVSNSRQWAGNIENEFQIALLKNFSSLDSGYLYINHPSMLNVQPFMRLRVDILRFDTQLSGSARLEAIWAWLDQRGTVIAAGNFSRTGEVGPSYESRVSVMSALLRQFTVEVQRALISASAAEAG